MRRRSDGDAGIKTSNFFQAQRGRKGARESMKPVDGKAKGTVGSDRTVTKLSLFCICINSRVIFFLIFRLKHR